MTWTDKVDHLMEGRPRKWLQASAGIDEAYLRTTLGRGSSPSSHIGIKIARALGVTAEWLFNDELGLESLNENRLAWLAENATLAQIARSLPGLIQPPRARSLVGSEISG